MTLLLVAILWAKRALSSRTRRSPAPLVLVLDLLTVLLICGWGTYFILMCDPRNSLTARMEAYHQWRLLPLSTRTSAPEEILDELRLQYRCGTTLGHLGLQLLVIPAFLGGSCG